MLTVLGVLLSLSGGREQQQQQQHDTATADLGSRHAGTGVDVYETSMHTGARLDQGFPSPAGLKEVIQNGDAGRGCAGPAPTCGTLDMRPMTIPMIIPHYVPPFVQ